MYKKKKLYNITSPPSYYHLSNKYNDRNAFSFSEWTFLSSPPCDSKHFCVELCSIVTKLTCVVFEAMTHSFIKYIMSFKAKPHRILNKFPHNYLNIKVFNSINRHNNKIPSFATSKVSTHHHIFNYLKKLPQTKSKTFLEQIKSLIQLLQHNKVKHLRYT